MIVMHLIENSIILNFLVKFYNYCYKLIKKSIIYRCLYWIKTKVKDSVLINKLLFDCILDNNYRNSFFRKLVNGFLNIVSSLFKKIYKFFPMLFNNSLTVMYSDKISLVFCCLFMFILFIFPQEKWNNLYSLSFVLVLYLLYSLGDLKKKEERISVRKIPCYFILFVFVSSLSALWSIDVISSFRFLCFLLTSFLTLVLFVNIIKDEYRLSKLLFFIGLGILGCSIYGLYQCVVGVIPNELYTDLSVNSSMPGRVYSFFENPNSLAAVLVFFLPIIAAMVFKSKKTYLKIFYFIVFVTGCFSLIFTYSRGGWISLFLALFLMILLYKPRCSLLFLLVAFVMIPMFPSNILNRILTIFSGDSSISLRWVIYSSTLKYIFANPVFGSGLGMNVLQIMMYASNSYPVNMSSFIHAHNVYLQIWAESSIFSLLFYILGIVMLIIKNYNLVKNNDTTNYLNIGCIAAIIGSSIFLIFDYAWAYPRIMLLYWCMIAVSCICYNIENQNKFMGGNLYEKK